MNHTPSIAFYLSKSTGEKTVIIVYVRIKGVTYKHSTGISISPSAFDPATQRVTRVDSRYSEYNVIINRYRNACGKLLKDPGRKIDKYFWIDVDDDVYTGKVVEHAEHKYLIDYLIKIFIPRNSSHMSFNRIRRFKRLAGILGEYETEYKIKISFDDITLQFYTQIKSYLLDKKGYTGNYFGTIIKLIKQVINEAYRVDSLHNNTQYLMSEFKSISHGVDSIYLTPQEIQAIYNLKLNDELITQFHPNCGGHNINALISTYKTCRDRFLIGCATGLRVSDYNNLSKDNIIDNKLTIITQKTKQKIVIPLNSMARDIFNSYDWDAKLSAQKIRLYIKNICQAAGITEIISVRKDTGNRITVQKVEKYKLVSTHTARRSFATNAYKAGIPALQICKITGHTTEKALLNYIKISNEENAEILANNPFFQ